MGVFRVEKSKDYTVMSNYHLRDSRLTLKAKGLLSQMLSLPEGWDYTLTGLSEINRESKDAIRSAVVELETAGYVQRRQTYDKNGKFAGNEYVIHEHPAASPSPSLDFPTTEKPSTENPSPENPTQLNIDISNTDISEKKNKKEKSGRKRKQPAEELTDEALRALVVDNINSMAQPDWTAADKNDLYRWVVALYDPERVVKKARPVRSKLSVDGTFRKLQLSGSNPQVMVGMLCSAIEGGWQGVQVPKQLAAAKPPGKEREYKCL